MDGPHPLERPGLQEIQVAERDEPDFVKIAAIDPIVLFEPFQDLVMLVAQVNAGRAHHHADARGGIVQPLVVARIHPRQDFAADQHVRAHEGGVAEILEDTADGERRHSNLGHEQPADGVPAAEMRVGELLAHHAAVPGEFPVRPVSGHQLIAENIEEAAVRRHRAAIDQLVLEMERHRRRNDRHGGALLDLGEILFQALVQIIGRRDGGLIGNHIDPVRILLERIGGQLPLDIHRQQEYESHGDGEPHKVHRPIDLILFQEVPK